MLEKLKPFGKGSVVVLAALGVVAVVTTIVKARRIIKEIIKVDDAETDDQQTTEKA